MLKMDPEQLSVLSRELRRQEKILARQAVHLALKAELLMEQQEELGSKTETVIEEKKAKTKAYRKVKGLTNSECRSLEIP